MNTHASPRSWEAHYPKGVSWSEAITPRPLFSFFDDSVARFADRPCLDFLGRGYSYRQVGALVDRAAKGFQKLGVVKGTRIGLCLPNCPYAVIAYYGALKAGAIVVNLNPLYVEREMEVLVKDSGAEILVTIDLAAILPKVSQLLDRTGLKKVVVGRMADVLPTIKGLLFSLFKASHLAPVPNDGRHVAWKDLIANDGRPVLPAIDPLTDVAVLQYTGGTTGIPKGAMLTHGNLSANTLQVERWFAGLELGQERMLGILPLFHVFAMTVVMNMALAAGAEIILLPRFDLKQVLETIHRRRPTLMPGVPTMYTAINTAPDLKKYDLSSIKFCISGGAPLPVEVKHTFEKLTGCSLVEGYGLSESSPVATCNPIGGLNKEGSIGIPVVATTIEIRDPNDSTKLLAQGEKGEVCIIGPQVMAGYWNRPDDTARTLIDGRLHTGDIGYMDSDGYTFLVDRMKDVILCGGYNVYPRTIEEALYLHPAVAEAVVIGVPDPYRGEQPKAFVRLRDGASATDKEIIDFLGDKISKIEMPKLIEFRAELPKTMIGKLSKKELKEEEAAKRKA